VSARRRRRAEKQGQALLGAACAAGAASRRAAPRRERRRRKRTVRRCGSSADSETPARSDGRSMTATGAAAVRSDARADAAPTALAASVVMATGGGDAGAARYGSGRRRRSVALSAATQARKKLARRYGSRAADGVRGAASCEACGCAAGREAGGSAASQRVRCGRGRGRAACGGPVGGGAQPLRGRDAGRVQPRHGAAVWRRAAPQPGRSRATLSPLAWSRRAALRLAPPPQALIKRGLIFARSTPRCSRRVEPRSAPHPPATPPASRAPEPLAPQR